MIDYIKKLFSKWIIYLMFLPDIYDFISTYFDIDKKLPQEFIFPFMTFVFFYTTYIVWKEEKKENIYLNQLLNGDKIILSEEATELLKEVVEDSHGIIMKTITISGTSIQTNNKDFLKENIPKVIASYEGALNELENHYFITTDNYEIYKVTTEGFKYIENN